MQTRGPVFRKSGGPTGWNTDRPPLLETYSAEPKYDLQTITTLVGVRPMILWSWERQLGVTSTPRSEDDPAAAARRYSERDLVAFLWLREQIVGGKAPADAAALLHASQQNRAGLNPFSGRPQPQPQPQPQGERPVRKGSLTVPLNDPDRPDAGLGAADALPAEPFISAHPSAPTMFVRAPLDSAPFTRPGDLVPPNGWPGRNSGPLYDPWTTGSLGEQANTGSLFYGAASPVPGPATGALGSPSGPMPQGPVTTGPLGGPSPAAGPAGPAGYGPAAHSGPLYGPRQPVMSGPVRAAATSALGGPDAVGGGPFPPQAPELRQRVQHLIRAFVGFDTQTANRLLESALAVRSFETVAMNLLAPALARVSDLSSRHEMNPPEERFALQYAREFLFATFHRTPERAEAPLAIVACAPREFNDIEALLLAVFWRRADARVVYLGPDMDGESLLEKVREVHPALVTIVGTSSQRVRTMAKIGKRYQMLEGRKPMFGFCGSVFKRHPELKDRVPGVFLGDNAWLATFHLRRLFGGLQGMGPQAMAQSVAPAAQRFSRPM